MHLFSPFAIQKNKIKDEFVIPEFIGLGKIVIFFMYMHFM